MTTYASVPAFAHHKRHPRALVLIVAGHAALLALAMMAKMELPQRFIPTVTKVTLIPFPTEPPENPPPPHKQQPHQNPIQQVHTVVPIPRPPQPQLEITPIPLPIPDTGPAIGPGPTNAVVPAPEPVRIGPRFITPQSDVRPPYPQSKLRNGDEAVLRLKLSIDERGRVVAVAPVGNADPVFLAAARRHLIAHWRYRPATEDGRAIASTTVITLRFQLDE
ncbi:MAG TPA: energy transducer TonB [Sphingomicrobium sp.]|nr:energy transducer TonB [Sphingomicrobium sp.]